jgi:hypothetical protein
MMSSDARPVRLSREEYGYLANATFLTERQLDVLRAGEQKRRGAYLLQVSHEIAEEFRDVFTTRLAQAGFDLAYKPTQEGCLLEALIDKFFEPG